MDFDSLVPHPLDEEGPPSVVINPHSDYGKELRKWEQHPSPITGGMRPGNPYVYRPYPRMLYKAQRQPNGQWACMASMPHPYQYERSDEYARAIDMVDAFNKSCTRIVKDEAEERQWTGLGWCESPLAALAQHEREEQAIGNAAAEAAYAAQRMTERARAEFAAAGEQTHEHVTDVVPAKKRGRPAKGVTAKVGSTVVEPE